MSPGDFFRSVWPSTGIYCLATPQKVGWRHMVFNTLDEAEAAVANVQGDLYFCIHTLKAREVFHPTDVDTHGNPKKQVRVQRNSAAAKCFFFDLDVGDKEDKYATQDDALIGLLRFCQSTGLPQPLVASSGGGLHVYWLLTDPIESDEWRDHATHLRQLALHYGLKVDRSRTTDTASVLRVVGTYNWKDPEHPRPVVVKFKGEQTATGVFLKLVKDAMIVVGVEPQLAPRIVQAESLLGNNLASVYDGPTPTMEAVVMACPQMMRLARTLGDVPEKEWYHNTIGVGRFVENSHRVIQSISKGHAKYSPEETIAKIKQSERVQRGPSSCATVAFNSGVGDTLCQGCRFQGKVWGPIQAALFEDPAPAPVYAETVGDEVLTVDIPDPPKPYTRMKDGGIAVLAKDATGDESYQVIYDYDLYPIRRLANTIMGTEQQLWHVELPRGEAKDFILDAHMLYDSRSFTVAISNQGIYPNKGHVTHLQEYMVAYISQLQKLQDADTQANHLGWSEEYSEFILPDKILCADGSVKTSSLSLGAQRSSVSVGKKGSMEEQIRLLRFYKDAAYLPHQFFILAGLGAPLFYMTGHHGVIVNASGDAGSSKSTSLYTASSFWGQPELYPINGTNNGATVRGRNERVTVLANLPVCVDEITHMPTKDAVDLAMSITQPGHRIRLETTGAERAHIGGYKATIMLATGNNSLHGILSSNDVAAGTAGSMRVFEIEFTPNGVHTKPEADDFILQLKQNFGHIGERFVSHVIQHRLEVEQRLREVMRELDLAAKISSAERYWSATGAVVIVTAEIAQKLGMLSYSPIALMRWLVDYQIPAMRGIVREEYLDPMSITSDYLEMIAGNIIVTAKVQGNKFLNVQHVPRSGALLAHYDKSEQLLMVLKTGFKDYCLKKGANSIKVLNDLFEMRNGDRVVCQRHVKRTLGAGTEYAKAQAYCFVINMAHPDVTGNIDLKVIEGGNQGDGDRAQPGLSIVE